MELEVTAAKLTGDPARDIKSLSNHVFMLEEKLRYTLRNLDVTNFNDLGLARYENGRLQIYTKEITAQTEKLRVELGKETDEIHALISATADELLAEIKDVEGNYTTLKATVNGIQSTVSSHTTSINNQAATNTSLQSQITQTANKISAVVSAVDDSSGNVTAASIVAAINGAASTVKISADHITLTGVVTVQDLSTKGAVEINAGNIKAGGTMEGVILKTTNKGWGQTIIDGPVIELGSGGGISYGGSQTSSGYQLGIQSLNDMLVAAGGDMVITGERSVKVELGSEGYYWEFSADGLYYMEPSGSILGYVPITWM
jgi:hypothetical protein